MERADGLVQRRNVAARERSGSAADPAAAAAADGLPPDVGEPDTDGDSKQARLTLMEQVLMLGLKDREVRRLRRWGGGWQRD